MAFDLLTAGLLIIFTAVLAIVAPSQIDDAQDTFEQNEVMLRVSQQPYCEYNATVYLGDTNGDTVQLELLADEFDNLTLNHITTRNITGGVYARYVNVSKTPLWIRSDGVQVYTIKDINRTNSFLECD